MAGIVRTQTSAPTAKWSLPSWSVVANGGYIPIYLSKDRTKFFATSTANAVQRVLNMSTDGGSTWSLVHDFTAISTNGVIADMVELPNGEVLIGLQQFNLNARVVKSSGFASNPATATWTQKFMSVGGSLGGQHYSLNMQCIGSTGLVLLAESGPQTAAGTGIAYTARGTGYTTIALSGSPSGGTGEVIGVTLVGGAVERVAVLNGGTGHTNGTFNFNVTGDGSGAVIQYTVTGGVINGIQTSAARRLYLSTDYGETFAQIFDIYNQTFTNQASYKYGVGLHLHGVAYDEAWDRIWVLFGDNTGDGLKVSGFTTNTQCCYSDDHGATWTMLPASALIEAQSVQAQYTHIRITPTAIMFGADAQRNMASVIIPRTGYRTMGTPQFGFTYEANVVGVMAFAQRAYDATNSLPIFWSYVSAPNYAEAPIYMSPDNGWSWFEFWRETDLVTRPLVTGGGVSQLLGPDTSGRVLGYYNGYASLLKGTIQQNF